MRQGYAVRPAEIKAKLHRHEKAAAEEEKLGDELQKLFN